MDPVLADEALFWYRANRRILPWRETRDPYRIWISEVMLQQTQVATVIPYYERFLERFPDPKALAAASLDEVFLFWSGLGYYRRARQLHAAANRIVNDFGGQFPTQLENVLQLPGVGRYTASAVLSFSQDQKLGIVEANTQRLYSRLMYLREPPQSARGQSKLWAFANRIMPEKKCGEFNQAMMEIGSQICTPKSPACGRCPFEDHCPTKQRNHSDRIPAPKPAKSYTELTEAALLFQNAKGKWFMRRCREDERWSGLWDFPRFDISDCRSPRSATERLSAAFLERFGTRIQVGGPVFSLRHAVTRYRITLQCHFAQLSRGARAKGCSENERWCDLEEIAALALNASGKRVLRWLASKRNSDFK